MTLTESVARSQYDARSMGERSAERQNREFDRVKDDVRRFLALESFREALASLTLYTTEVTA